MAYQKLQVSNGLAVIPSATVRIPNPDTQVLTGVADFSVAGTLTDVGTTFLSAGIEQGAIIYNTTDSVAYYINAVTDDLNLAITSIAGGGAASNYVIYNEATVGCILFVGVKGDIVIQLAQQNGSGITTELTFKGIAAGAFLPTQAVRVAATTTSTDIIALW
tara:strand:+ start:751 stop:1236 length:486 start_codon:yes stop_codon:yes gene_type:complete